MKYLAPFKSLKNSIRVISSGGQLKVDLNYDELMSIIKKLLLAVPVDDAFYRSSYPDVAEAIDAGTYRDAKHHFVDYGYFEGRRPFPAEIDEAWYLKTNPDVVAGLENGTIQSVTQHFADHGYDEGRLPIQP